METLFTLESDWIGMILRATVLLAAAVLLTRLLHKSAAQTRHLLWTATFVLLLSLPLGMAWMPTWELPLLPASEVAVASTPVHQPLTVHPFGVEALKSAAAPQQPVAARPFAPLSTPEKEPTLVDTLHVSTLIFWIWAVGCGLALWSMLIGLLRYRTLVRAATPLTDPHWWATTDALRAQLRIRRQVRLVMSEDISTPMTGGWRAPVVLLPKGAQTWSAERREVVLAHELVHVQRHDALRQLVGHATLALYWFHPLSWLAARLSKMSRELACDEGVLALGARPSAYATHLLALADGLNAAPAPVALPMIQKTQLEERLMAILKPNRPRANMIVNTMTLLLIAAIGLTVAVAQPTPALVPAPAEAPVTAPDPVAPPAPVAASVIAETPPILEVPVEAPVMATSVLDEGCRAEGMRGSFSGTISTTKEGGETRQARSGWFNGDRMIQQYDGDLRLCMRIHGEVVMANDGLSVRAVGADSWVALEAEEHHLQQLIITEDASGITYTWRVDGKERPFDNKAQTWRDQMFVVMNGYWEASRLRGQESSLRGEISSHRGEVSSMRGEISSHKGHISSMRGEISSHHGEVSSMRGEISSHRGEVSSMRGEISSLRGELSSMRGFSHNWDEADRKKYKARKAEIEVRIAEIEAQIDAYNLDAKVREIEARIEAYGLGPNTEAIEREIDAYDLDGKVREIEQQIEAYDLDAKVRKLEQEIKELDADRRATEIERNLKPEVDKLRSLNR